MDKVLLNQEREKQHQGVQRAQQNTSNQKTSQLRGRQGVGTNTNTSGNAPIQAKYGNIPSKNRPVVRHGGHDRTTVDRSQSDPDGTIQRKEGPGDPPWYERAWNATTGAVSDAADYVGEKASDAADYVGDKAGQAADYANEKLEQGSVYLLNKVLPVSMGVSLQLDGGITWGIPLYTGGSATCYITRTSNNNVHLKVRKQGTLAFDTGVGASFMVGGASKGGRPGAGVGGEAGANFQAGVQGTHIEEYNIPVSKFLKFVGSAALSNLMDSNILMSPINQMMTQYGDQYRYRQKFDFGVFAQGDAEAGIGVRRRNEDATTNSGASTWNRDQDRNFEGSRPELLKGDPMALLNFLGIFGSAKIRGQANMGLDQRRSGKKTVTSIFMEGEVSSMINLPIPMLNQLLQMLPSGIGIGAELEFTQEPGKDTVTRLKVYQKSGEDEVYAGSASKQSFNINLSSMMSFDQLLSSLKSGNVAAVVAGADLNKGFEKVSFFHRMLLTGGSSRALRSFLRKQQGTRSLLSDKTKSMAKNAGVGYDIYLDLGAQMSGPDFMKIVQRVLNVGQRAIDATKDAQGIAQTYKALQDFFTGTDFSSDLEGAIDDVMEGIYIDTAMLRFSGSVGAGISGKLSAGAKVRGDLSGQGGIHSQIDYVDALGQGGRITLKDLVESFPRVMNDPLTYFPGNPLIRAIYGE